MAETAITLEDEGMHPADDHPQFNESALLTFFDSNLRSGGYLRIGNRPNEGHAEATFCWFMPDGSALFSFDRAPIATNDRFATGKIGIDVVDAGKIWAARFDGEAYHLASPRLLTNPKAAFTESPKAPVHLDLKLSSVSPIHGAKPFPGLDTGGHYKQHMRSVGTLTAADKAFAVNALGNRDHSWGPRVWQSTHADRTIWCTFAPDFGVTFSITWKSPTPHSYEVIGEVWRGSTMTRVVDVSILSAFDDPEQLFHKSFRARLSLADGQSLEITGRTLAMAPLRHRRDKLVTYIGWAMAEMECEGQIGIGLSEYLDSVV